MAFACNAFNIAIQTKTETETVPRKQPQSDLTWR